MRVRREQRDAEAVLGEVAEAVRGHLELGGVGLGVGVRRALGDAELHLVGRARGAHGERERGLQQRVALAPVDPRRGTRAGASPRRGARSASACCARRSGARTRARPARASRRAHAVRVRAGQRAAGVVGVGLDLPRVVGDGAVVGELEARWRAPRAPRGRRGARLVSRPCSSKAALQVAVGEREAVAARPRRRARRARRSRRRARARCAGASRSTSSSRANGVRFSGAGSPSPSAAIAASRSSVARAATRAWSRSASS